MYLKIGTLIKGNEVFLWDFFSIKDLKISKQFLTNLYEKESNNFCVLDIIAKDALLYGKSIFLLTISNTIEVLKIEEYSNLLSSKFDVIHSCFLNLGIDNIKTIFILNSRLFIISENKDSTIKGYTFFNINSYIIESNESLILENKMIFKVKNYLGMDIEFDTALIKVKIPLLFYSNNEDVLGILDLSKFGTETFRQQSIPNLSKFKKLKIFYLNHSEKTIEFCIYDFSGNKFYKILVSTKMTNIKSEKFSILNKYSNKEKIDYITIINNNSLRGSENFKFENDSQKYNKTKENSGNILLIKTQQELHYLNIDSLASEKLIFSTYAIEDLPDYLKKDDLAFIDLNSNIRLIQLDSNIQIRKRINKLLSSDVRRNWNADDYLS